MSEKRYQIRDPLWFRIPVDLNDESWVCTEEEVVRYFEAHYKELGFSRIIKKQHDRTPDFICLKNGKEVKVEIEYLSSGFVQHRHRIEDVDVIICVTMDKEIKGVEVITLDHIMKPYHYLPFWEKYYEQYYPELLKKIEQETRETVEKVLGLISPNGR